MSVMSMLDLQCQEAQELFTFFLDQNEDVPPAAAIEALQQLTYLNTPVITWEITLPYMMEWAWREFALSIPAAQLH